jgi:hypothetical protein
MESLNLPQEDLSTGRGQIRGVNFWERGEFLGAGRDGVLILFFLQLSDGLNDECVHK